MMQGRHFYERALALDPDNIDALVGTGRVDMACASTSMVDNRDALLAAAEATLTKAVSIAPRHALAHLFLGIVQMVTNRPAQGIRECEQSLALDRNLAEAHACIGLGKYYLGLGAETEAHVNEAFRLSPRDTGAFRWMQFVGIAKLQVGANAEAIVWLLRCLEANRNHSAAHFQLAAAFALLGRLDKAQAAVNAGLTLNPTFTIRRMRTTASSDNAAYLAGRERICEGMRMAGVPEG